MFIVKHPFKFCIPNFKGGIMRKKSPILEHSAKPRLQTGPSDPGVMMYLKKILLNVSPHIGIDKLELDPPVEVWR